MYTTGYFQWVWVLFIPGNRTVGTFIFLLSIIIQHLVKEIQFQNNGRYGRNKVTNLVVVLMGLLFDNKIF